MSKNVSQILKSLSLPDEDIISIYLVGSRLWGTHTESSDFDLLVIVKDTSTPILRSHHKKQYDITLLTKLGFIERMRQGSFIEIICCLIEGDEARWLVAEPMRNFLPDIGTLEAWVAERNLVDYEKAEKFWAKGKTEEAFKILQHIITATVVTRELKRRTYDIGHLHQVTLSLQDLRALVRKGRDSDDTNWLNLPWSEVEAVHRTRARNINTL